MKVIFKGNPLGVVENLKKEIIKQVQMIKLDDENFECSGVEEIQQDIDKFLNMINMIYQDLLVEHIYRETEIFVAKDKYGDLDYSKI